MDKDRLLKIPLCLTALILAWSAVHPRLSLELTAGYRYSKDNAFPYSATLLPNFIRDFTNMTAVRAIDEYYASLRAGLDDFGMMVRAPWKNVYPGSPGPGNIYFGIEQTFRLVPGFRLMAGAGCDFALTNGPDTYLLGRNPSDGNMNFHLLFGLQFQPPGVNSTAARFEITAIGKRQAEKDFDPLDRYGCGPAFHFEIENTTVLDLDADAGFSLSATAGFSCKAPNEDLQESAAISGSGITSFSLSCACGARFLGYLDICVVPYMAIIAFPPSEPLEYGFEVRSSFRFPARR